MSVRAAGGQPGRFGRFTGDLAQLLLDRRQAALEVGGPAHRREALVETVDAVLDALQALGDGPHATRQALQVGGRRLGLLGRQ